MLKPANVVQRPGTTDPVIAGNASGVRVLCSAAALPIYNILLQEARSGNHWARLVVSGIAELSAGRLTMNNVFVRQGAGLAYGRGAFYVVLPGVTCTFEQLDNGAYILLHMTADTNYYKLQSKGHRPGLWKAKKKGDAWKADFIANGQITPKENRFVVIADAAHDHQDKAASKSAESLASQNATISRQIETAGFDMHFTPGKGRIGGLKNARQALGAERHRDLHETAQLLANTMYRARDIEGVLWFSDWGGSGVLTQAMQILVDQGISLDKHAILMNHPTTQPSKAMELGLKLGLKPEGKGRVSGYHPDELVGHLGFLDTPLSKYHRLKHDADYGSKELLKDTLAGAGNLTSTGLSGIGVGATVGVVGSAVAASPVVVWGGAILAVFSAVNSIQKTLRRK